MCPLKNGIAEMSICSSVFSEHNEAFHLLVKVASMNFPVWIYCTFTFCNYATKITIHWLVLLLFQVKSWNCQDNKIYSITGLMNLLFWLLANPSVVLTQLYNSEKAAGWSWPEDLSRSKILSTPVDKNRAIKSICDHVHSDLQVNSHQLK